MSLYPQFTIHLWDRPYKTAVSPVNENTCTLTIGDGSVDVLTIFLPANKLEQVQRIADALNDIGKPVTPSPAIAA